jgi:spore maturation protein CgeB
VSLMRILCVFGRHNYGDPARGDGYEFTNFLPALKQLGHEVAFFDSLAREPYQSFSDLNRRLLKEVVRFRPEILFCVLMQYEVWIETLRMVRNSGVIVLNWATDDSWKYQMFSRFVAPELDLSITTYPGALSWYRRDGIPSVHLSQWAANADWLAPPLPADRCRYQVTFVGSAYGKRPGIIESLCRSGIEVTCFGQGWPAGPVAAKRIPEVVRESQISVNFSENSQGRDCGLQSRQIKARVFEVTGFGGCLVTEAAPDLDRYFHLGEEVVVFEGVNDLANKIRDLLAHPEKRDAIAWRGYERVRAEHSYDVRFRDVFDDLARRAPGRSVQPIDWVAFESAAAKHACGPGLHLLRTVLVMLGTLVWGRQRGPRAARRFAVELSWRLAGARTYAAAGWPGRMFYKES